MVGSKQVTAWIERSRRDGGERREGGKREKRDGRRGMGRRGMEGERWEKRDGRREMGEEGWEERDGEGERRVGVRKGYVIVMRCVHQTS